MDTRSDWMIVDEAQFELVNNLDPQLIHGRGEVVGCQLQKRFFGARPSLCLQLEILRQGLERGLRKTRGSHVVYS